MKISIEETDKKREVLVDGKSPNKQHALSIISYICNSLEKDDLLEVIALVSSVSNFKNYTDNDGVKVIDIN